MKLEVISKRPSGGAHPTPLLFVHGASEGRENLRWARVAGYVEDVANAAGTLPLAPVVIGHSMGGLVVQKYLEDHAAPAGVLLASAPPAGVLATTLRIAARHPLLFAKVNLTLSLFALVATPELAREAFFSPELDEAHVRDYTGRLQDESYLGFLDMLALNLPRPARIKAPLLVLGGARDTIFHAHEIEATARAYATRAEILPEMAHDMMLEPRWQDAAGKILSWLDTATGKDV